MKKIDVELVSIQFGVEKMDVTAIHHYLSEISYWARGISSDKVKLSIENSFCAGAFYGNKQVGFVRAVTDYSTFAWISDVYVLEEFAGEGIGKKMLGEFFAQEWFGEVRRIMLATKDAHSLYEQFDFTALDRPEMLMQVLSDKFTLL
ncbi:GNAT family N-acetyltransferase [Echinicola strongylocentroti]|uniref:GNAT family N-acetyltransferase n=1 Tax=Echinicola strongylocentroti TaxID=1795355 RepID=A0A2Z4IPA2_9BACT|nr:GNAT family N-acetyltransferase [Echinicola strongylocentroti]AWW32376.1 GNAT family N-acetyltransferase [Echinicola strongylocentroti]